MPQLEVGGRHNKGACIRQKSGVAQTEPVQKLYHVCKAAAPTPTSHLLMDATGLSPCIGSRRVMPAQLGYSCLVRLYLLSISHGMTEALK